MADEGMPTCGDCIHADVCEEAETLVGFSRMNKAYCGMFLNAADVVEVVRCKDCDWFREDGDICVNSHCVKSYYGCRVPREHFCSYGERRADGDQQ